MRKPCFEAGNAFGTWLFYADWRDLRTDMGLRRVVVRSTGSRNGVPVYYKGTQALPEKQSGSIGKARRNKTLFVFPTWKQTDCTTALVLKPPKPESSIRTVFLPRTVAMALLDAKKQQDEIKLLLGSDYQDFGLVLAQPNGRPYERR